MEDKSINYCDGGLKVLPTLFTEKELREVVFKNKLSKHNVYGLMHSSGFPTVKIGRKLYISKTEFIQWVHKNATREV
jgi:hypothetical protein